LQLSCTKKVVSVSVSKKLSHYKILNISAVQG